MGSENRLSYLLGIICVALLAGCTARQRVTEQIYRDKDGNIVKLTRTVTETVKEDRQVLHRSEQIKSCPDGKCPAPADAPRIPDATR